jgi:hypothetical protein
MSSNRYISRLVNLETIDHQTILKFAFENGFGEQGFSAALRSIIREWALMRAGFSNSQGKDLYADIAKFAHQTISSEDKYLESGAIETEFPSDTSEPQQTSISKSPDNEYDAALNMIRAWKFTKPPQK